MKPLIVIVCLALIGCKPKEPPLPSQSVSSISMSRAAMLTKAAPLTKSVTLMWDGSASIGQVTYFIHQGVTPGNYTNMVLVGYPKTHLLTGLIPGVKYYLAASCTDSNGLRSAFSNEINYTATATGTVEIVLWTGPTPQGPWPVALTTNRIPATNVQAYFNQTIRELK